MVTATLLLIKQDKAKVLFKMICQSVSLRTILVPLFSSVI